MRRTSDSVVFDGCDAARLVGDQPPAQLVEPTARAVRAALFAAPPPGYAAYIPRSVWDYVVIRASGVNVCAPPLIEPVAGHAG